MDNDELTGLLARCALKDQQALTVLYRRTAATLNAVAYRVLGSQESSNEVLQEAFVQIWDNAATYTATQGNALTWMCSIVRYRAIDKLRQEKRHQNRPAAEEEETVLTNTPGAHTTEDIYQHFRMSEQVRQCLEAMNEKFRRCVELAYLQGYSRDELAATLDTNVNTIKSWLHRGSAKLKECLQNSAGGLDHD